MQEETKDNQNNSKAFSEFRKLTGALRDVIKKRQDMLKAGASPQEILSSKQDALYYHVRIRESFRELHQVAQRDQKIETKSNSTTKEKAKLETISNYYEGLQYQKNNIEREILNCRNVALPDLEKLDDMKDLLESLGKRVDPVEIEELDRVFLGYQANLREIGSRASKKKSN